MSTRRIHSALPRSPLARQSRATMASLSTPSVDIFDAPDRMLFSTPSASTHHLNPDVILSSSYTLPEVTTETYLPSPHVRHFSSVHTVVQGHPTQSAIQPVEHMFNSPARPRIALQTIARRKRLSSTSASTTSEWAPPLPMPQPVVFSRPARPRQLVQAPRLKVQV